MGLCGMIVDFFGPIAGARHDEYVNRVSQFNQRLATVKNSQAQQYSDYRDKEYVARSYGHIAFKGRNLPYALIDSNTTMSPQRVGVIYPKKPRIAISFLSTIRNPSNCN